MRREMKIKRLLARINSLLGDNSFDYAVDFSDRHLAKLLKKLGEIASKEQADVFLNFTQWGWNPQSRWIVAETAMDALIRIAPDVKTRIEFLNEIIANGCEHSVTRAYGWIKEHAQLSDLVYVMECDIELEEERACGLLASYKLEALKAILARHESLSWWDAWGDLFSEVAASIGETEVEVVPFLVEKLKSNHPCYPALLMALGRMGDYATAAVPDLLRLCDERSEDSEFQDYLMECLFLLADVAVGILSAMLHEPHRRDWAATTLARFGSQARGALPILIEYLEDNGEETAVLLACEKIMRAE